MKIIIANTDIGALIKASSAVLKRYESTKGNVPDNIKGQVALSVLKKVMQHNNYFDICAVHHLAKMNEIVISAEHEEFFSALHCIQWADMTEDTREYLLALLVQYFQPHIVAANLHYPNV